jgi:hypothetical protein
MKTKFVMVSMLVATNAMAYDFETEYAKFSADFSRLRGTTVAMVATPKVAEVATTAPVITALPETNLAVNKIEQVDPKSPFRLGRNLQDPEMKKKMDKLYSNPDTVVYSLTLE